ncbi:MAG: TonB-dependent receptor, partial [Myxococcota bacterium]
VEPPGSGQDEDEGPPPPDDQVYPDNVSFVSTLEDQSLLNPAYYADMVFKPWEGATFVPGVRVDQFGATSQLSISPRLTARQQLGAVTIKGGAGIFTQPPQPLFTNPVFGDRDLLPEFSAQYSLGAEWQLTEALMVDAEVFYRDMRRLVVQDFEIFIRDDGTADFTLFSNDGRGRAYGAELLVKHDLRERVFGWLAYTLSRSERLNLRSKQWDLYRNDQTHILTLVGGYKFPRGFTLSSRLRLVSGFPFTPVVDSVYDVDAVRFEPVYGEPNSAREVFFRQLDVRAEKEWTKQWGSIAAFLDVINATNARNVESSVYTYDWRQRREVTGFPFIPTLGVQARW